MIIDGKVYRNLEGQVEYLTEYLQSNAVAAELGIKVVGEAENVSDIPAGEYSYGDAYMIGTEAPYEMYIWTRASGNHPEDFWFNVGHFPMPGPQGEPGLGVDNVASETVDITHATATQTGDLTQFQFTTTITETLTDNTSITIPTTINIPVKSDGQVSISANEYEHHGRETIQIGLSDYLPDTYVKQKVPGSSGPHVYGANEGYGTKVNNLADCPIRLTAYNIDLYRGNNTTYQSDHYNTVLGKENVIGQSSRPAPADAYACTENLVFGGKNTVNLAVQDSSTFGYRNTAGANQAFTAGYKNENYGVESIVIGNQNFLDGNTSVDTTPDPDTGGYDGRSSTTKHMAVFGSKNSIQHTNIESIIGGYNNKVNTNGKWNFVIGANQNLGKYNACVNALDYGNTTGNYIEDSTMIGYGHHIYGGTSNSWVYAVNMIGHDNNNIDSNGNYCSDTVLLGNNLCPTGNNCVVVGAYNAGDMDEAFARFVVGTGVSGAPATTIKVFNGETDFTGIIKIGNTSLSEAQLQSLLALI